MVFGEIMEVLEALDGKDQQRNVVQQKSSNTILR
jgi:hypothetical protein